jgi:MFS family permease
MEVAMPEQDWRRWIVVGVLFVTLFLIWGPVNASGVFFLPVIKHFGWSRTLLSSMVATAPLAAGLSGPGAGWLIDRIGARKVMIPGAALVALGYFGLSRANSPPAFLLCFMIIGVGITASTIIPTVLVITRNFAARRGLALGIAFSGIPLGGTAISILANHVVIQYGFRAGYLAMAAPIVLIVIPLMVACLAARSGDEIHLRTTAAGADPSLPGLEVGEALRSRSFWMIALADLLFALAGVGLRVHLVPLLVGMGYSQTLAAELFGAMFLVSAVGSFLAGVPGDYFGGRRTLVVVYIAAAAGIATLFGAQHLAMIAVFLLSFGLVRETPAVLIQMVIVESMGIRRHGAILGILGIFTTIGFAAGPVVAGRIFDSTGSYSAALWIFIAMAIISAIAISTCLPLKEQRHRLGTAEAAAA